MRTAEVEIYSDATNAAVMKHPDRQFPGVLVQGDTLHALCVAADASYKAALGKVDEVNNYDLVNLRNKLNELLSHYKVTLSEHHIPLPFSAGPDV